MKQVLQSLVNIKTGEHFKKWVTKRQMENFPFYICLPYEEEDRKEEYFKEILKGGEEKWKKRKEV